MPLPEGVPEEVEITCASRVARFLMRPQRVLWDGEEMPPSKFEAVCGKGDAKKWKATLHVWDPRLQRSTVCMQARRSAALLAW